MAAAYQNFGEGTIAIGITASPIEMFECQINAFTVQATANTTTIPGTYCAGPSNRATASSFAVAMEYLTDWGNPSDESLSQLLWDNDGGLLYFVFTPADVNMPDCSGTFWSVAGPFGGPGNDVWTGTGTMPCPEQPTITPKTP